MWTRVPARGGMQHDVGMVHCVWLLRQDLGWEGLTSN